MSITEAKKVKQFLTHKIRLAWRFYSEKRRICLRSRRCRICEQGGRIFADHIHPVVDVKKGFVDWNTYIKRMFEGDLQPLCAICHKLKSKKEGEARRKYKWDKKLKGP